MNKRAIGTKYEQKAADYLVKNGYNIVERNFRCRMGEIDLIAQDGDYLCFIEVKYRSTSHSGFPGEAINPGKVRRIVRTAQYYMLLRGIKESKPCRFDVVFILDNDIELIRNAFDGR